MSYKWNDSFTLIFLNAYKKHPCLWNPYHIKYYNCLAKNEALKNIIKELSIPELNISDCLEQIKVIREKYGQEQIRIIEGYQSQKPYKSSLAWLSVISEMLGKVIIDEDKLQNGMRSMKTISPNILKSCVTSYKYKNIDNFPCAQAKRKPDYKIKHGKNRFTDKEISLKRDFAMLDAKINRRNNTGIMLQCPFCGWEDIKSKKLNITSEKICESIKSSDVAVPCPKCNDSADKPYEGYNAYRTGSNTYCERYNSTVPHSNFSHNISNYIDYPENILPVTTHLYHPQFRGTHNYTSSLAKQQGTSIKYRNKGVQNTICVSKTNIIVSSSNCATMLQISNRAVADTIRKYNKEVQTKPLIEELKQVAVNTMKQCDEGTENTTRVSRENCNNQAFEKSLTIQKSKQVDRKTVKCPEDMQNVIGIKLKNIECSVPNFLFISSDGNCVPLKQTDFKLKQLTIDKCQNTDLCQDLYQKGVEKVCVKETCSRDAIEIIKHNSVLTQALLQCLEKIILLPEKTKMHSVSSFAKKDDVNSESFETTICDPCKFANDSTHFATSSAIELESCLSCLKETEKDNVRAMFIKTFLELMKHALVSNSRKRTENNQEKCIKKENASDTFIILNKIKECADKILKIYAATHCSKKQLSNQFCPRYKSKSECPPKDSLNSIQTQVSENDTDQFTTFYENSKDIEVLYGPSMPKIGDHDLPENQTTFVEVAIEEKPSVKDKEITAHSESHDIDVTVSLPSVSVRNSGTQYTPRQLQDTGIVTEHGQNFEEKISVGTQNCEAVLIRIIKCNDNGVLMLDKETSVRDTHVAWKNRMEPCPVLSSRLLENVYRKYLIGEYYDEQLLHPDISDIHEKEMNCIDYRMSSLTNKNYRSDKQFRNSSPYNQDWRKANIPIFGLSLHQRVSRIPLYMRSHKYTRRRIDRYKISQSCM